MNKGIYIHVPFCRGKCPYCDFYSLRADEATMDAYVQAVGEHLRRFAAANRFSAGSVYFGGGTPSLLGAGRLCALLEQVDRCFPLAPGAEVTAEVNPSGWEEGFFSALRGGGFTRISAGMQSADPGELRLLGRAHTPADMQRTADAVHRAGFPHFSLDLMTALPVPPAEDRRAHLRHSVETCAALGADHVSAYMLKVEEGTFYHAHRERYAFPDEDTACEDYLLVAEELEARGYAQYEISNFARPGGESRHNLLYWRDEEYLGIGPAAHSFLNGRRFYYPRDLQAFLAGTPPVDDGPGGSFVEFVMLGLRLSAGITRPQAARFPGGEALFDRLYAAARALAAQQPLQAPLLRLGPASIALTRRGFLVSNAVIGALLEALPDNE